MLRKNKMEDDAEWQATMELRRLKVMGLLEKTGITLPPAMVETMIGDFQLERAIEVAEEEVYFESSYSPDPVGDVIRDYVSE